MKKFLSIFMSLAILVSVLSFGEVVSYAGEIRNFSVDMTYGQSEARTIFNMINELRTGSDAWYWNQDNTTKTYLNDLSELQYDYALEKVAMQRACEIAIMYSHTRPNGSSCFTAYDDMKYDFTTAGENIAYGQMTAEDVNFAWREDSLNYSGQGHRRNMLNKNFKAVGIGHVYYNNIHFWVEEFSGKVNSGDYVPPNDSLTSCTISADMDLISHNFVFDYDLEPTCTTEGSYKSKTCTECGYTINESKTIPALDHSYTIITHYYPTYSEEGYILYKCSRCGYAYKVPTGEQPITQPARNKTTPQTVVTTAIEQVPAGAKKIDGVWVNKKYKKPTISKLAKAKKSFKITWKKVSAVSGYQVQYAKDKKFKKNKKTVTVKGNKSKKPSKTIKKLKSKKTYYVRIRTYKIVKVNGKSTKVYSSWSKIKFVKTK